jgi:acetyltransferase-like isoleucine patch superfamily enzyme
MAEGMNGFRDLANVALQMLPTSRFFGLKRLVLGWAGVEVGSGARVNGRCWFYGHGRVRIGADTWVGPGFTFHTSTGALIDLGSRCDVAPEVSFITGSHAAGIHARRAGAETAGDIRIGDGCWIGARTTVLAGVTIGAGSMVAAGALVRLSFPEDSLLAGVPAALKKELPRE